MEQERRKSLLGAALNIEYGPCSVAAAELARAAHADANILNGAHYPSRMIASDLSTPVYRRAKVAELTNQRTVSGDGMFGGDRTVSKGLGVYLAQDVTLEKVPRYVEVPKSRKFVPQKKGVVKVTEDKVSFGDIWLADGVLGGQVLLPLATFQPRTDGNCSYVQIGPEINDDSIFAVQGDEDTKRLKLIDDMRKLFPREGDRTYSEDLREYVWGLREEYSRELTTAICAYINNDISKYIDLARKNYHTELASLSTIEGEVVHHYDDACLVPQANYKRDAERKIIPDLRMYLVGGVEDGRLICGISRRGKVLRPILEIMRDTGEHQFVDPYSLDDMDKYRVSTIIADQYTGCFVDDRYKEYRRTLGEEARSPRRYLMNKFDINEFDSRLQPACKKQERLAAAIGAKAVGKTYSGTVLDINMNNTDGSVSGTIEVKRFGDIHQARIVGIPDALVGMHATEIASFEFDPTEELGDKLPMGEDAIDFAKLIEGFSKID